MKKQQQAQKEKFRPRRSNAGVGFFTIAREERLAILTIMQEEKYVVYMIVKIIKFTSLLSLLFLLLIYFCMNSAMRLLTSKKL